MRNTSKEKANGSWPLQRSTTGKFASAIFIGGKSAVIISNNRINGGKSSSSSFGIFNFGSEDATIRNNIIYGGGSNAERSTGITTYAANKIYNNVLQAGSVYNFACGVHSIDASPFILSNTIINGASSGAKSELFVIYASANKKNSYPFIINNIIVSFEMEKVPNYGIYAYAEKGKEIIPEALITNDIYSSYSFILYRDYKEKEWNNIKDIPGNISENPEFANPGNDFHLTSKSPKDVIYGGSDLSGKPFYIIDDLDGNMRTKYWSIGAYEYK